MGVENFSVETLFSLGLEGTWDVPGILPGRPRPLRVFKKFVQKEFVLIFGPWSTCYRWAQLDYTHS